MMLKSLIWLYSLSSLFSTSQAIKPDIERKSHRDGKGRMLWSKLWKTCQRDFEKRKKSEDMEFCWAGRLTNKNIHFFCSVFSLFSVVTFANEPCQSTSQVEGWVLSSSSLLFCKTRYCALPVTVSVQDLSERHLLHSLGMLGQGGHKVRQLRSRVSQKWWVS